MVLSDGNEGELKIPKSAELVQGGIGKGKQDSLVVWVLYHINHRRLINAKSIFIQMISSISNTSV